MSTFSTRSGRCNRCCARFSAGAPPPTIGFRMSARSAARSCSSVSCSILTSISPRARCFRPKAALFTEAARMLGAQPWQLARRITLPLARPAIAVGAALALLETLNDIGASEYLGVQTLTLSIFTTWLNRGSLAGAAQMACLMLLIVAALIALERYGRRRRAFTALGTDGRLASRIALAGPRAMGRCRRLRLAGPARLPAARGLSPARGDRARSAGRASTPISSAIHSPRWRSPRPRPRSRWCSASARSRRLRYTKRPTIAGCVNIAGIGYAVPGTVLALGLLSPLVLVDEAINCLDPRAHRPRGRARAGRFGAPPSSSPM